MKCTKHNHQARRFRCNYVPGIITPPLFGKLLIGAEPAAARQELCLPLLARPRSDSLFLDEPSRNGLDDLKATNTHPFNPSAVLRASFFRSEQDLCRHKLYYPRLYQIGHLPVKENLSVYLCLFTPSKSSSHSS